MRVAIYARVSSEKQVEKDLSIPAQLKSLKKYAADRGWEVVREYIDEAESARTANRPQFKGMVAEAKRKGKPFDTILVWKLSRFARNREDSILYKSLLRKHGVQVLSINEPIDDSAAGKLLEGMIEVIDEFYSSNLAEDVLRGMAENASKGFYSGGNPPFGYKCIKVVVGNTEKSRLEINDIEASVINRITQLALENSGCKEIAKTINKEGSRTRNGRHWSKTMINKLLQREVYTGCAVWHNKKGEPIRCPDVYPSLINRSDFTRIQELIVQRRSSTVHPRAVYSQYLLSTILRCGGCGSQMIGCSAKSGKFHYYRCNNALKHDPEVCQTGWLPKDKIENFVVDKLKERILTEENIRAMVALVNNEMGINRKEGKEKIVDIDKQLNTIGQKLLKYFTAFENSSISEEDAGIRIKELRIEQDKLQKNKDSILTNINSENPVKTDANQLAEYVGDLRSLLSEGSIAEQKIILKSFIKKIDYEPKQVTISYTTPLPVGKNNTAMEEVLSMEPCGRS